MNKPKVILILGGARSGKSRFAQEIASKSTPPVLFVATAEAGDEDMRRRIGAHKRSRPSTWRTLEAALNIGNCIKEEAGTAQTIIIDCVTLLVNNIFNRHTDASGEPVDIPLIEKEVVAEIDALTECLRQSNATFIIVSNEVGLGLVPANRLGRVYRDVLGRANQMLAQQADEVHFMVAGIPVPIKSKC